MSTLSHLNIDTSLTPATGSEFLYASFFHGIADLACMKSPQGVYLLVNPAFASFLGKAAAEIVGQDDCALFPEDLAQRFASQDREVFASESGSLTFENEIRIQGRTVFLRTVKSICRDPSGKVVGLVAIARDLSDRKLLEETLRQREHDLNEAQRIARIGTWTYDCVSQITIWSDEIYRIYGVDPSQPAQKFAECLEHSPHPKNQRFVDAFDRAIRLGEPYRLDLELTRPDGSKRWILATGEVNQWCNGKIASLRGTVQEITDRKQAEREIALRENRYRSLVHATSQIVWATNARGDQMKAVPEWIAFTGQSEQEAYGFGWATAIHPEDREATVRAWRASILAGTEHVAAHRLRRHDGVYRDMTVRAVPVRDDSGQIVEWVGTHTDVTDQKLAEAQNQIAQQRLQNVLESITDGLCVLDRDLRYVYFNEPGARMVGVPAESIVGTCVGDTFVENKTNAIQRSYRQALQTGQPVHVEEFTTAPLNKWFESNCYPSPDGLTVYFRDITERKRTEKALQASESRFRRLFDSPMIGICFPDRFGAFKEGNEEFLRITGYSRADLDAGLVRWDTMTPPQYAALDAHHIAEAAQRGSCTPYEKEYIRKDGSRVPILCGYALLEGSQDEYIGFLFDLTRQREAEAELREREQRFRLLAETLPELVWLSDPVGTLIYLNSRFLTYCGIPPEAMVGFDWRQILHPEELERVNEAWTHSVQTGEPYRIELRMRSHDGVFRYFLARALPMLNEAGGVERWVGSCTDVHDQRLAEEALRRSEKLAATGRLAASIAHEINNPLASVTNSLYLALLDTRLPSETRELLQTADEELARVSQITTQTLRFHRQSKAASSVGLGDIMQSVLTLFRRRFASRQVQILTEFSPDINLLCFEDELRQIFANVISNALDATIGAGRLRIRIRPGTRNGASGIRIIVADTGSGIPAAIQHRIFEPFFSTKDATGIGLGLWVSDGIVRKHGGTIRIRSWSDPHRHGTVLVLFFPQNGIR